MKVEYSTTGYDWASPSHEVPKAQVRPSLTIVKIDDESLRDGLQGTQLEQAITTPPNESITPQKPFFYTQKYSTFALGLKKKSLRRSDAYE